MKISLQSRSNRDAMKHYNMLHVSLRMTQFTDNNVVANFLPIALNPGCFANNPSCLINQHRLRICFLE